MRVVASVIIYTPCVSSFVSRPSFHFIFSFSALDLMPARLCWKPSHDSRLLSIVSHIVTLCWGCPPTRPVHISYFSLHLPCPERLYPRANS